MRVTTQELLMAGWHSVYTNGKQFWSHPELCSRMVPFRIAASFQKMNRKDK